MLFWSCSQLWVSKPEHLHSAPQQPICLEAQISHYRSICKNQKFKGEVFNFLSKNYFTILFHSFIWLIAFVLKIQFSSCSNN